MGRKTMRKGFVDIPALLVYVGLFVFFVWLGCSCYVLGDGAIRLHRRIKASQLPAKKEPSVFISSASRLPPVRRTIPPDISDFSWLPDKSAYVFSKKVPVRYYVRLGAATKGKRFRVFIRESWRTKSEKIGLKKAGPKVRYAIGCEDHLAPLVSPDGEKIAFVVSRKDHPSAVWVMNSDGSGLQQLTPYFDSIAFAWITNKAVVFWGSPYSDVDLSQPSNYGYGRSFVVNVENGDIQPLVGPPEKRLKIKYVSFSLVKEFY